jgi:hypothetical protein
MPGQLTRHQLFGGEALPHEGPTLSGSNLPAAPVSPEASWQPDLLDQISETFATLSLSRIPARTQDAVTKLFRAADPLHTRFLTGNWEFR